MIISHAHKFIFIHIPKCGGTAVSKALLPYLGKDDLILGEFMNKNKPNRFPIVQKLTREFSTIKVLPLYCEKQFLKKIDSNVTLRRFAQYIEKHPQKNGYEIYKHATAAQVRGFVSHEVWDSYFTFTFVRNPWDRIVSAYFWMNKTGWRDLTGTINKVRSFPNFTSYIESGISTQKSCSSFVFESGKQIVDFIGKQENLEQDFTYICNQIGLPDIKLSQANVTKRERDYRKYHNEQTRQTISNRYRDDIENFNYQF